MNFTTLAASCALLGALALSNLPVQSGGASQAAPTASDDETTLVIRYDPNAIFLTHQLVAPLCSREVKLLDDSGERRVGELAMVWLDSNALQPKGVFVGRVRVNWAPGVELPAERREAVFESGLAQLRSALARRLVQPRREELERRVAVLEVMEEELREAADVKAQELARGDELADAVQELDELTVTWRARWVEHQAAKGELEVETTKTREREALLEAASAAVDKVSRDMARKRELADDKVISEFELQVAEAQVQSALNELNVAAAQLENQQIKVAQHHSQLEAAKETLALFGAKKAELEERIEALSNAGQSDPRATLRLGHTIDQRRLAELGAELQLVRAALATIPEVTIERW